MPGKYSLNLIKWSLRKAVLPISDDALVLDVGSGSNPHPSADVLLEKFVDITHRYSPLVADRPTVLADACKMPFKAKAFDYVIAFDVLEHINTPELFLNELQRIGKAGYIETPNAVFERLVPYDVHVLEIMDVNGELIIHKKASAKPDVYLNSLDIVKKIPAWNKFFYNNPALFHVRYFWENEIKYKVTNPELNADWINNIAVNQSDVISEEFEANDLRSTGLKLLRKYAKSKKRRKVNLSALLACPECHSDLAEDENYFTCSKCRVRYSRTPIPDFNESEKF
ncbi:MAG: methyltransferase domain-containing protein [bacterium]|nr:methyltransferase domain-containing protein [bacterium]